MSRISSCPGAELVEKGASEPCSLRSGRRVFKPRDCRLRGERCPALGTATDRELQKRIVPEPVEVVAVLVAASDGEGARRDEFYHLVPDAALVAGIGHRFGKPPTHARSSLSLAQQQQARVGGLVAAVEIDCEFLAADGWQIEGKRRIVGHGGCGVA